MGIHNDGSYVGSIDEWEPGQEYFDEDLERRIEEEREEESLIKFAHGNVVFFVGVYDVNRNYGGPEEGGWWFDSGELIKTVVAANRTEAESVRDVLQNDYPHSRKRYSVLGGEDYDIYIFEGKLPDPYFPEERPHYE
jgi:hypothetical protein